MEEMSRMEVIVGKIGSVYNFEVVFYTLSKDLGSLAKISKN